MAKKKPYQSPGHIYDHHAFNLPTPSGGDMAGDMVLPGSGLPPAGVMGQQNLGD